MLGVVGAGGPDGSDSPHGPDGGYSLGAKPKGAPWRPWYKKPTATGPELLLQSRCAEGTWELGKQCKSNIGMGVMARVLHFPELQACLKVAVPSGGHGAAAASKPARRHVIHSLHDKEIDMTRLLWDAFGRTGLCVNLMRPLGATYLTTTTAKEFEAEPASGVRAMIMTPLSGIKLGTGVVVYDLEKFIDLGSGERSAVQAARFVHVLKGALFHAAFALYVVSTGLEGSFRHNDMHCGNVGLHLRDDSTPPCAYQVSLPRPDGTFVTNVFHIPKSKDVVQGVVIDFGCATLLPPLTDVRDSILASRQCSYGIDAMENPRHMAGMSCEHPCQYYDLTTLLGSVNAALRSKVLHKPKAAPIRAAAEEFCAWYSSVYGHTERLPHAADVPTSSMFDRARLTLDAQRMARIHSGAFVTLDDKQRPVVKKLLTPAEFLCSEYFADFAAGGPPPPAATCSTRSPCRPPGASVDVDVHVPDAEAPPGQFVYGLVGPMPKDLYEAIDADIKAAMPMFHKAEPGPRPGLGPGSGASAALVPPPSVRRVDLLVTRPATLTALAPRRGMDYMMLLRSLRATIDTVSTTMKARETMPTLHGGITNMLSTADGAVVFQTGDIGSVSEEGAGESSDDHVPTPASATGCVTTIDIVCEYDDVCTPQDGDHAVCTIEDQ